MLLWVFRAIFLIVIAAVLFVNITSRSMVEDEEGVVSEEARKLNFHAVIWSSLGMALFVFLLDVFTPNKKLTALAGVFFGLLVGILISLALTFVVDMIMDTYRIRINLVAVTAIKSVMGICVCYLSRRLL